MQEQFLSPILWLGIVGWAATAKLVLDSVRLTVLQQRVMIILTWILWMVPAFDIAVYRGIVPSESALSYASTMMIIPTILISFATIRWNSKS